MFDRIMVQKALKGSRTLNEEPRWVANKPADDQSSVISQLIYDIFGGEILKTHKKNGWHFYNRINGERIDFTRSESGVSYEESRFEDILSTPDETHNYFELEEYTTFFIRFIREFEEAVGLKNYRPGYAA